MHQGRARLLYWAPRALAIVFAAFISLFALDVFSEEYRFWEKVLAFVIHLIPTYLVFIALAVAWRWERVGGFLFLALGLFYIVMAWDPSQWIAYLIISGPLFLLGILFIVSGQWRRRWGRSQPG
jgi:hypothetical protein